MEDVHFFEDKRNIAVTGLISHNGKFSLISR
jgi:hypothetical protein